MSVPLEDRIYARLSEAAALAALVGTRISPGKAAQKTAVPYIEFYLDGNPLVYTHDGPVEISDTLVQFDSFGKDYDEVRAVNRALLAALASDSPLIGLYFFIENDGTDPPYEEDMRRHRVTSLARVWYRG